MSSGSRLRAALQKVGGRLAASWRGLPPARRSALTSLVLLSTLLLALLTLGRPAEAPLRLPPPARVRPHSEATGTAPGRQPAAQAAPPAAPAQGAAGAEASPAATQGAPANPGHVAGHGAGAGTPALDAAAPAAAPAVDTAPLAWPVRGPVVRSYGMTRWPGTEVWHLHGGVDIAALPGEAVAAAAAGTVAAVENDPALGTTVILDHGGGRRTLYAGLAAVTVEPRQRVARAQVIGRVGQPGPAEEGGGTHLHFAVEVAGQPVDPLAHLGR